MWEPLGRYGYFYRYNETHLVRQFIAFLFLFMILGFSMFFGGLVHADTVVSVRAAESSDDWREEYNIAVIRLAMDKTASVYSGYELQVMPPMNHMRLLSDVGRGKYQNPLIALNYNPDYAHDYSLVYVNFPIDLGISGTRICFVSQKIKEELRAVRSIEQLRAYSIGQGAGWADALILRHNHFKVIEVASYSSLFKMVAAGRIDLVCRGANEIQREIEYFGAYLPLIVDEHFAIEYPLPRFFFTNAKNTHLKERMEKGLALAYADGSLVELWKEYYADSVASIKLDRRLIFHIDNPLAKTLSVDYRRYSYKNIQQ